jgi:hypothetical protein
MIITASPSKPFQYTPKSTPRRHFIINEYEKEIENAYAAVKDSSQVELLAPGAWNVENSLLFARAAVEKVMKGKLTDDDDIFQNGCDR